MLHLALILHLFIGATLGGVFLVAALVAGYETFWTLLAAGLAGFVIAVPVAVSVAKRATS